MTVVPDRHVDRWPAKVMQPWTPSATAGGDEVRVVARAGVVLYETRRPQ